MSAIMDKLPSASVVGRSVADLGIGEDAGMRGRVRVTFNGGNRQLILRPISVLE